MRLSKDLGVPMYKAVVESAEFAHNFSMTELLLCICRSWML